MSKKLKNLLLVMTAAFLLPACITTIDSTAERDNNISINYCVLAQCETVTGEGDDTEQGEDAEVEVEADVGL